tara:strand:- start:304 stop:1086 length:783 start_codon:yes stop_codon:yes gene_type:complete
MGIKNNQSLWSSVILHGALIVALFLSTIIEAFLPKEKPHVFEMVSQPSPSNAPQNPSAPIDTPPDLELRDMKPIDIADPVISKPAPTPPKPVVKPLSQTTPVKATPKPLISAADFFKKNPKKNPKPLKSQPTRPAYQAPTINTSKIQQNLQSNLPTTVHAPSGSLTAAQRTALQRYGDQLNSRLNRAWIKPANLAGVGLVVTVVFDVSSSGRISNIRLRPASGNPSFDTSVKAAFTGVRSGGVTPTGQAHSFTMSFKMVD